MSEIHFEVQPELQSNLEVFEFTKQEESAILEVVTELSEIICDFIANDVKGEQGRNVTVFDIISQMIGQERAKAFHFAITGVREVEGRIRISTNENSIAESCVQFLEGIIQAQLDYFKENIPLALEHARGFYLKHNDTMLLAE